MSRAQGQRHGAARLLHPLPTPFLTLLLGGACDILNVKHAQRAGGDKRVRIYSLAGTQLTLRATSAEAGAAISALSVSPDGTKVAAGDALREVRLYAAADAAALVSGRWMAHTTRVTGCRWNPAGSLIATVSSDRRLCVWDPSSDAVKRAFDLAHPHPIAAVAWASDTEVWIAGTDGIVVKKSVV